MSNTPTSPSPGATTPSGGSGAFAFPRPYFFPPFYTMQPNKTTLHAQLVKWSEIVLAYCQHHRIFRLSLAGQTPVSAPAADHHHHQPPPSTLDTSELFSNRHIGRSLAPEDIRKVIDFLAKDGRAEYVGGGGGGGGNSDKANAADLVWIHWRSPDEWAALVEAWVDQTGQKGSVLTFYELTQGDATRGTGMYFFIFFLLPSIGVSVSSNVAAGPHAPTH